MAITATTKVLTLDYWKPASQLEVGDYVFDRKGQIVKIKSIQQYRAQECYQVWFNDNLSICGDKHLVLPVESHRYRKQVWIYKGKLKFRKQLEYFSAKELQEKDVDFKYSVQTTFPLEFPHQDLPVPPFVFGFWMFNRIMSCAPVTQERVIEKFKDHGYYLKYHYKQRTGRTVYKVSPSITQHLVPFVPIDIPNNYLFASKEQRQELLSGIVCARTVGYDKNRSKLQFSSKILRHVQQVQYLAESLGHKTHIQHRPVVGVYVLTFQSRLDLHPSQILKPIKVAMSRRYINDIVQIEPQLCVHIETTAEDSTILVGEGFIACR